MTSDVWHNKILHPWGHLSSATGSLHDWHCAVALDQICHDTISSLHYAQQRKIQQLRRPLPSAPRQRQNGLRPSILCSRPPDGSIVSIGIPASVLPFCVPQCAILLSESSPPGVKSAAVAFTVVTDQHIQTHQPCIRGCLTLWIVDIGGHSHHEKRSQYCEHDSWKNPWSPPRTWWDRGGHDVCEDDLCPASVRFPWARHDVVAVPTTVAAPTSSSPSGRV